MIPLKSELSEPLHLFIVASEEVTELIQKEFALLRRPKFRFTSFCGTEPACRFLTTKDPVIDLAVIALNHLKASGGQRLGNLLRLSGQDCPVIVLHPANRQPSKTALVSAGIDRASLCVEEPMEMADLIGAAAIALSAGPIAWTRARDCSLLRLRAKKMLKQRLHELHSERGKVELAVQDLLAEIAGQTKRGAAAVVWNVSRRYYSIKPF